VQHTFPVPVPVLQSVSAAQSWTPVEGAAQTLLVCARFCNTQTWPEDALHFESLVQETGHWVAATHALPADP